MEHALEGPQLYQVRPFEALAEWEWTKVIQSIWSRFLSPRLQVFKKGDTTCITVHVQPRAARTEIAGFHGETVKVRLTSPASENRANRHLVDFFSHILKIPKRDISIVAGEKSRLKTLAIKGISRQILKNRLTQYLV